MEVASLASFIDKKLLVILRDGRKLVGVLRCYDQFANFVLQETSERIYSKAQFADIPRGIFLIRGENVVFCGEIDEQKEMQDRIRLSIEQVPVEQILISQRAEAEERERLNRASEKLFKSYGFLAEMEKESF